MKSVAFQPTHLFIVGGVTASNLERAHALSHVMRLLSEILVCCLQDYDLIRKIDKLFSLVHVQCFELTHLLYAF